MANFHITHSGEAGVCRAQIKCPLGGASLHFETASEARVAYEVMMSPLAASIKRSLKSLDADGLRHTLYAEARSAGMDVQIILKATELATLLHEGQYRAAAPGEVRPPYITHPLRNSVRVIRWGSRATPQVLITMLHDVVEDSPFKYAELEGVSVRDEQHAREVLLAHINDEYGERVASGVFKLSNPLDDPVERASKTVEQKHAEYVAHVREAIAGDEDAFLGKLSDLHDNASGLYHTDFVSRRAQTRKQATKYLMTVPALQAELERNPFSDPAINSSAADCIKLIDARLRWMLNS